MSQLHQDGDKAESFRGVLIYSQIIKTKKAEWMGMKRRGKKHKVWKNSEGGGVGEGGNGNCSDWWVTWLVDESSICTLYCAGPHTHADALTHTHVWTNTHKHTHTRILFELYSNLAAGIQDKDWVMFASAWSLPVGRWKKVLGRWVLPYLVFTPPPHSHHTHNISSRCNFLEVVLVCCLIGIQTNFMDAVSGTNTNCD